MPYQKDGVRQYKKEREKYHSRPEQMENNRKRKAARRKLEKEGLVHKGDGRDVGHKKALAKGGSNSRSNLRVESKSHNRSVAKTRNNRMKGNG